MICKAISVWNKALSDRNNAISAGSKAISVRNKAIIKRSTLVLVLLLLSAAVQAAASQYRVEVDGLACPFCAYGIEKKLHALPGVERIETDIKEGAIIVTMSDGAALDEATARQAVKDAGFTLRAFKSLSSTDDHE